MKVWQSRTAGLRVMCLKHSAISAKSVHCNNLSSWSFINVMATRKRILEPSLNRQSQIRRTVYVRRKKKVTQKLIKKQFFLKVKTNFCEILQLARLRRKDIWTISWRLWAKVDGDLVKDGPLWGIFASLTRPWLRYLLLNLAYLQNGKQARCFG